MLAIFDKNTGYVHVNLYCSRDVLGPFVKEPLLFNICTMLLLNINKK